MGFYFSEFFLLLIENEYVLDSIMYIKQSLLHSNAVIPDPIRSGLSRAVRIRPFNIKSYLFWPFYILESGKISV
jgi:hypothetical protein